jgi:hypothetical protein
MKILKFVIWIVIAILIIIQFIPVSYPEDSKETGNDLIRNNALSEEISTILKTSCYDCHSNETHYPWYSYIAPAKWLVIRDIRLGREGLNFSEWENLKPRDQISLLDGISEEVEAGSMPMPIYTLIHRNAILEDDQKKLLIDWTEKMINDIFGE